MCAEAAATINVLGGFEVRAGGVEITLGGPLQRLVLARLVAAGDVSVTADQIVTDVWGDRGAAVGSGTLHTSISRLRKLLGAGAIQRRGGGYALNRAAVAVDADRFTEEVRRGRQALARAEDVAAV